MSQIVVLFFRTIESPQGFLIRNTHVYALLNEQARRPGENLS
jgi:hypothetical protein